MIKDKIIDQIAVQGILPMYINSDLEVMKQTALLCSEAGLKTLEVLNRVPDALEIFIELKDFIDKNIPGFMLSAGTITDVKTAKKFIDAGASMIIAPNLNEEVGRLCIENNIEWLPGVFTISEFYKAKSIGATGFKLFPANLVSPDIVNIVKTLLPETKVIASGGIRLKGDSIPNWINAGADAIAIGNGFFTEDILSGGVFKYMKNKLLETVEQINTIRN